VPSVVAMVENANLFFERDLGVPLTLKNINHDFAKETTALLLVNLDDMNVPKCIIEDLCDHFFPLLR